MERVMSTQKLPNLSLERREKPRMKAITTAIPAAADTKFWTVRPTI